jgi:hypothetical protein
VVEPVLTELGREAAENGTPERQLLLVLDLDDNVPMSEVHEVSRKKGFDGGAAVQWIFRKKWARKVRSESGVDVLKLTHDGEGALLGPRSGTWTISPRTGSTWRSWSRSSAPGRTS